MDEKQDAGFRSRPIIEEITPPSFSLSQALASWAEVLRGPVSEGHQHRPPLAGLERKRVVREVVKKSRRFRPAACPAIDRDLIPIRGGGEVWFFSGARVNRGPSMIHARRRESGISRSRDRRSDRLYRVSSGGLLVHFLAPFPFSLFLSLFLERYSSAFFTLGRRRRTENYRRYLDRTRYRFSAKRESSCADQVYIYV